jgi:RNA polymerase sigma-70 factor (ECF subfamily)
MGAAERKRPVSRSPSRPDRVREPELDALTLERARRHDLAAFERLYRTYVGRVYALCLRLCGEPARAEDLTQEVFVRVWEKIDAFAGRSSFYTWLYRLTVNRVTDAMRAELRRASREVQQKLPDMAPARPRPAPETSIALERAIAELPAGARVVFVLYDVEGYTHEEISKMTGIATGTSKAQLHRARRLLREKLGR